ncbi:hypothetical protein [Xylanibacter brevis]|uniref:hypothetical protein n=1 Tax=Xylanibacter brevis TaxID=83231 RepID=UPI0012DC8C56|nr:hypothetical protein [Xylanibacter brevis]
MKRLNLNFVIEFQEFGFKKLVSSFRVQVSGNWFQVSGFRFQVLVSGVKKLVSRNWFQGSGFRFQETGFWVQGSGFKKLVSGFTYMKLGT